MKITEMEMKDHYTGLQNDGVKPSRALDSLIHTYQGQMTYRAMCEFQRIANDEISRSCKHECDLLAATFIAATKE